MHKKQKIDSQEDGIIEAHAAVHIIRITELHAREIRGGCRCCPASFPNLVIGPRFFGIAISICTQEGCDTVVNVVSTASDDKPSKERLVNECPSHQE